ncbi:MAG: alpha/beta hydrolase [Anaerolineae bacterium]|nr:alpha/beta hydrolase [Anaerolineae bacterium]
MAQKGIRIFIAVVAIAALAFIIWGWTPAGPGKAARAALKSDAAVTVVREGKRLWFCPAESGSGAALVFYPGGHVDYRSYAPILRRIAEEGTIAVVQRMPFSLAVLAAASARDSFAQTLDNPCGQAISSWYIGGHSLGGAMAAVYVDRNPEQMQGLVLWGAYPDDSLDLSGSSIRVLSVYASNDGLVSEEERTGAVNNLPASTTVVEITGGNHAQFGDYGRQAGDGAAAIPAQTQWDWTAQVTSQFIIP